MSNPTSPISVLYIAFFVVGPVPPLPFTGFVMWVHKLTPPLYSALHISFPFLSPELNTINTLLVPTSPRGYELSACDRIVSHLCAQLSRVLRTQRRDKQRATPSASPPETPRDPRVVATPSAHCFSDQRASALLSSDKR